MWGCFILSHLLATKTTIPDKVHRGSYLWIVQPLQFNVCGNAGVLHATMWPDTFLKWAFRSRPDSAFLSPPDHPFLVPMLGLDGGPKPTSPTPLITWHMSRLEKLF